MTVNPTRAATAPSPTTTASTGFAATHPRTMPTGVQPDVTASSGAMKAPASARSTAAAAPKVTNESRSHFRYIAWRRFVERYRLKRWYSRRSRRTARSTSSPTIATRASHSRGRVIAHSGSSMLHAHTGMPWARAGFALGLTIDGAT